MNIWFLTYENTKSLWNYVRTISQSFGLNQLLYVCSTPAIMLEYSDTKLCLCVSTDYAYV